MKYFELSLDEIIELVDRINEKISPWPYYNESGNEVKSPFENDVLLKFSYSGYIYEFTFMGIPLIDSENNQEWLWNDITNDYEPIEDTLLRLIQHLCNKFAIINKNITQTND